MIHEYENTKLTKLLFSVQRYKGVHTVTPRTCDWNSMEGVQKDFY